MYWKFLFLVACFGMQLSLTKANDDRKGIPDFRHLVNQRSRSTGTGPITFWYALVSLMAFALFVILIGVIFCYKREKGIRGEEKTLFLPAC